MPKAYKDYYWKNGKPYGKEAVSSLEGTTFRIVIDPYHSRFSIEQYLEGAFHRLIYDSAIFNFSHLRRPEHASWLKEPINEHRALIRNHDDRVILFETYEFEKELCRTCHLTSPHGTPLSTHRLYYEKLGDPFNGVILFDINDKPILKKTYVFEDGKFTDLLSEDWTAGCDSLHYSSRV